MTTTVLIQHQGDSQKDVMVTIHNENGDVTGEHNLNAGQGTQIILFDNYSLIVSSVEKSASMSPTDSSIEGAPGIIGNEIKIMGSDAVNEAEKLAGDITGNL